MNELLAECHRQRCARQRNAAPAVSGVLLGVPLRWFELPSCAVGGFVWPGTSVAARGLQDEVQTGKLELRGKHVVELGAGTGVLGIALAARGADCVLTDGDMSCLDIMRRNVAVNASIVGDAGGSVHVEQLVWGSPSPIDCVNVDILLAVDVIYTAKAAHSFLDTISSFFEVHTGELCLYLSHRPRDTMADRVFFGGIKSLGLQFKSIYAGNGGLDTLWQIKRATAST